MNRRKFIATTAASVLSTSGIDVLSKASAQGSVRHRADGKSPNIVLIICDDLGFGDPGCYGGALSTPNLDQLARDGARLTHFNSPHPTCSAARAALLTGQYGSRVGVSRVFFPYDKGGMNLGTTTIATLLKAKGYHTTVIGKWHLGQSGEYLPKGRGFDDYLGVPYSVDMHPLPLIEGTEIVEKETDRDTLTQKYTAKAVETIKSAARRPFFLYLAHSYPHIPIHASADFRGKSQHGIYGDAVMEIDWSLGEVRKALREEGIEDNTLIMFTSDHGPWYQGDPGRLKGRKDTDYEGGVRVPFVAAWPGRIPRGRVVEEFVSNMDVLPTVAKLCEAEQPGHGIDGVNMWQLLSSESEKSEREGIVLYTSGTDLNVHCARLGDWKVRFGAFDAPPYTHSMKRQSCRLAHPELYDLRHDPTESYDIANAHPEMVAKIIGMTDKVLLTFPENVQQVYHEQKANRGKPYTSGARPVPLNHGKPEAASGGTIKG